MRSFLEQADAAHEAATGIRRHMASLDGSNMGETLKRSDRLDAQGAELEYRWLTLTVSRDRSANWWAAWWRSWSKRG
jgi:hypothetical protein